MAHVQIDSNGASMDISDLLSSLEQFGNEVTNRVADEIDMTALEIETDAKTRITQQGAIQHGTLRDSINATFERDILTATIVARTHYAPYIEFGTGTGVDVPSELAEYASQFKGGGIRQINKVARPYFFPAYNEGINRMIARLKEFLDAEK